MKAVLLACALGLLGCKARAPRLEPTCTFDQDCALTMVGPDCCDRCEPSVGSAGSVAALSAWCAQKPAGSCPKLDCQSAAATASCADGRCVTRAGIH